MGNGGNIVMEHDGWGWNMIIDNETYFKDSEPNIAIVTADNDRWYWIIYELYWLMMIHGNCVDIGGYWWIMMEKTLIGNDG